MDSVRSRDQTGIIAHLLDLTSAALRFLKATAVLAGMEAKAAGLQYGIAVALIVAAMFLVVLGYVFLVVTAVFAVGAAFDRENAWIAVMGVAALLHIGGAVALALLARRRVSAPPFPETLAELEKDQLWLKQLIAKN